MGTVVEIVLAAAIPVLVAWAAARVWGGADLRRAATLFAVVTIVWTAPCWMTAGSPAAFDYLTDAPPWTQLRPEGVLLRNPLLNDVTLQILPWRESIRQLVLAGEFPAFDPRSGVASPLWENPQAQALWPVTWLGIAFSTFAWPLFAATAKLLLALFGTYLFLRGRELSHEAACFGALSYAFCTFTIAFLLFPLTAVTVLQPLLLYAIERTLEGAPRGAALTAVTIGLMAWGGHPESVFHGGLLAAAWTAWLLLRNRTAGEVPLKRLKPLAIAVAAGALLAAPSILPFAGWLPETQRVSDIAQNPGFLITPGPAPRNFIPIVVPNFFGNPRVHNYRHEWNYNDLCSVYAGLIALVFALVAAIRGRERFWTVTGLVAIVIASHPPWFGELLRDIPIFGVTAHGRLRYVFCLAVAVLGAAGFDMYRRGEAGKLSRALALAFGIGIAALLAVSYPELARVGVRRLVVFTEIAAGIGLAAIVFRWPPRLFVPLLFLDLFSIGAFYNPALQREAYYPVTPAIEALRADDARGRVAGVRHALMPNSAVFYGLEDIRPHDPMTFHPYVAFLDRHGLDRGTYFAQWRELPPRPLLDFLGVRRVIAAPAMQPPLPVLYRGPDAVVAGNPGALPRYFVPAAVKWPLVPVTLADGSDPRVVYAKAAVETPPATLKVTRTRSSARIAVDAPAETFIASSEIAVPSLRLRRNGRPWPVIRTNDAFAGWKVPAGRSLFEIDHRPPYLTASLVAGLLGVILTIGLMRFGGRLPGG